MACDQFRMRIWSMPLRHVHAAPEGSNQDGWSCIKVEPLVGDDVEVVQVFGRNYLSSSPRTSSRVVVYRKANRKHLRLSMRTRCFVCRGASENRCIRIHEAKGMALLPPEVDTAANTSVPHRNNSIPTDEFRKYTSMMPHPFFP